MKKNLLLFFYCALAMSVDSYSQSYQVTNLDIQGTGVEPEGYWMRSATTPTNHGAFGYLGMQRRYYKTSSTGSGNDRNDKVGIWIKGFYQNVGDALPVYLGGAGYSSHDFKMVIESNGNVGIGVDDTQGYKLAVNGSAIFTKAVVKLYGTWPDYVFQRNYRLLPLNELERFIQKNNHLPNIPSAAEVEKNGIDLGDNQALLLEKIEQLTLYIIELNKKVEELSAENVSIKKKVTDMKNPN